MTKTAQPPKMSICWIVATLLTIYNNEKELKYSERKVVVNLFEVKKEERIGLGRKN